jgi:signal transduction histidine kinase
MPVTQREWALFGARWVIPAAILVSALAGPGDRALAPVIVVGITAAVVNLLMLLLLLNDYWSRAAALAAVIVDGVLAAAAVYVTASPLLWLGLVSVIAAGFYFDWVISLITGLAMAVALLALQFLALGASLAGLPLALMAAIALAAAGPIASLASHDESETLALRSMLTRREQLVDQVTRMASGYMRVVYEMAEVLSASRLEPRRVLDSAVEFGLEGLQRVGVKPPLFGAILLFDADDNGGTFLRVARAGSTLLPSDQRVIVPGEGSAIAQALAGASPVLCAAPAEDPELRRFETFRTCRSVLCLPLNSGADSYGVMLVGSYEADAFKDVHIELMQAVTNQAAASLNNARLYAALRDQRDRIVEVERSAREQLAGDLHDGPTQGLAAIAMRLNYIRRLIEKKPESAVGELYQIEDMARRTTKEIRHLLFELRPKALERGLESGLQQLALKMKDTYDQDIEVKVEDGCDQLLDEQTTQTLFSIVTECVNNSRKHAGASLIRIEVGVRQDVLVLQVSDNGRGFDVETALEEAREREGHLGLLNLKDRAALIDATLTIQSEIGKGTCTTVAIPVEALHTRPGEQASRAAEPERDAAPAGAPTE